MTATGASDLVPGFQGGADGRVSSLVVAGGALFAGGEFGNIGGGAHARVARLDPATGVAAAGFTASANAPVRALAASPDALTIYAGGEFTQAGGPGRNRLAAFAADHGRARLVGSQRPTTSFAPSPSTRRPGPSTSGASSAPSGGAARARLAAISAAGAVLPFDAALNGCHLRHTTNDAHSNPACDTEVDALTVASGVLYVGGRFAKSGSTVRHDAAAFTLANGALHGWNPVASDRVLALAGSGAAMFVGGELTSVNGGVRPNLAALDATTGQLDPTFNPVVSDEVLDIAVAPGGTRLFLAGHFALVGGKKHNHMAAVALTDGKVDAAFKPNFNNDVLSIAVVGNSLYAGGQFTKVTKVTKKHVVKLDPIDGCGRPCVQGRHRGPGRRSHCGWDGAVPPGRPGRLQGLPGRPVRLGQRHGQAGHRRGRRRHRCDAAQAAGRGPEVLDQRGLDRPAAPVGRRQAALRRRRLPGQHLPVGRREPVVADQPDRPDLAHVVQRAACRARSR